MPIEVHRIKRKCPDCGNETTFDTGKNYFCNKCLTDIPKQQNTQEHIEIPKVDVPEVSVTDGLNNLFNQ